ncbi:putative membrane protein YphA (DoxX/SURF4 family) [Mucilaginibacter sp. SG538B]|uniref:MauE/DoxX family redox-associated membrane protein n=1 Tax=Mucilaginibacter sp. SG538B TaxID=2587021 RepID=UPI00159D7EB3|nr:MauE/DoxX family redox-associated membrane protein [Mucilaginibacter sp. SG538B]NVM62205.1 putative membrane protein YphA (DoxX/SURF4 family) [Mucilaginibacter sp. SG538B]
MKKELQYELITALLVLLFLYTGLSKLLDFKNFEVSMRFQHLPGWITVPLTYVPPLAEITVAALMIPHKSRLTGIYIFLAMMTAFTIYVGAAWLHLFQRAPCACGGALQSLNWEQYFALNLVFVTLAVTAIRYNRAKRMTTQQKPSQA